MQAAGRATTPTMDATHRVGATLGSILSPSAMKTAHLIVTAVAEVAQGSMTSYPCATMIALLRQEGVPTSTMKVLRGTTILHLVEAAWKMRPKRTTGVAVAVPGLVTGIALHETATATENTSEGETIDARSAKSSCRTSLHQHHLFNHRCCLAKSIANMGIRIGDDGARLFRLGIFKLR